MADEPTLLEGMATTRSIRRYTDRAVTTDELATMLWHATRAPSGSNRQPFRFVVLRHGPAAAEARRLLADGFARMWADKRRDDGYDEGSGVVADSPKARMAATMDAYVAGFAEAPVIVLACLRRYRAPHLTEGGSVFPACQNLLLAARAIGLGGTMTGVHGFVEDDLRRVLGLPDDVAIAATITIGEPAGRHGPVRRRPLGELVFEDRWDGPADWAVDPPGTQFTSAGPPRSAT